MISYIFECFRRYLSVMILACSLMAWHEKSCSSLLLFHNHLPFCHLLERPWILLRRTFTNGSWAESNVSHSCLIIISAVLILWCIIEKRRSNSGKVSNCFRPFWIGNTLDKYLPIPTHSIGLVCQIQWQCCFALFHNWIKDFLISANRWFSVPLYTSIVYSVCNGSRLTDQ